jgi:hypothetical protein
MAIYHNLSDELQKRIIEDRAAHKENPYAFRKVREMCNDYYESYNPGKSILRKPF